MPLKYNNTDNYLAYKNLPIVAVLQNGNYIYGKPASGIETYEINYNAPAKVYTSFLVSIDESVDPLVKPGIIIDNPTQAGGTIIASGSTISWTVTTEETADPGYTDAAYTVKVNGRTVTSPYMVTGDVTFDFESEVKSYTLSYSRKIGCSYVRIKRVGGVGYRGTDDVEFFEFANSNKSVTVYYGDILTIQEVFPSEVGYNAPTVTFGNGSDTITVTENVTLNIVSNPKEFKILYPAAPVGTSYSIKKGSTAVAVDTTTGGELSVLYNETYTIRVWAEQYYKSPACSVVVQTSGVKISSSSKTISSGGEDIERAREFGFTINKESDYQLTIAETEQCATYTLSLNLDKGTNTDEAYLSLYRSPYYYSGETNISSVSQFTLPADAEDKTLLENTRYFSCSAVALEGYAIENVKVVDDDGETITASDLVKSDITLTTVTSQGTIATIVYPAFPEGVTGLYIRRTNSKYSRTITRSYYCDTTGGSFNQFDGGIYCYIDDVLELNATRPDFYFYPTIGVADDLVTGITNSIDIDESTETLIIQGGTQAITVTFTNTADEVAGWWDFEIESDYLNSAIGIESEGDNGWISTGSHTLCVGDRIVQRGNIIKIMGNSTTPVFYMRHSANIEYRSPACALLKDGAVVLASTRDATVSYEIVSTGTYTTQYLQGPLKTKEWVSNERTCSNEGTYNLFFIFDNEEANDYAGKILIGKESLMVDGVTELPNITQSALWYKAKRYVGDGITGSFPRHDLTLENGGSFDEDWERTAGAFLPDSASSVLVGDVSWVYENTYGDTTITGGGGTYLKAHYSKASLHISKYDSVYIGTVSSTCVHWTCHGVI